MPAPFRLWENAQIVELLSPAADAAGRTSGTWVTMKFGHKAYIVCYITQGNAATILLTPLQATSNAGAGSKALSASCPIAACLDTVTSDQFTLSSAANYTTDAGVKHKIVVFEIQPEECMDMVNGFTNIGVSTGASNAANITSALLVVMPLRDQRQNPPTTTGV